MKKEDGNNSDNNSNDNSDCNSVLVGVIKLLAARWIWRLGTSVLAPRKEARSGSAHEIISLLFSFQCFILLGLRLQRIFTCSFGLSCWAQQPQRHAFVCRWLPKGRRSRLPMASERTALGGQGGFRKDGARRAGGMCAPAEPRLGRELSVGSWHLPKVLVARTCQRTPER